MFLKRSTPKVSQAIRKKSGYLYFMLFNVRLWLLVVKYLRLSRLFLPQNAPQTSEVTLRLSLPLSQRDLNAPGPFQVQRLLQAFICKTPLEVHVYRSWVGGSSSFSSVDAGTALTGVDISEDRHSDHWPFFSASLGIPCSACHCWHSLALLVNISSASAKHY